MAEQREHGIRGSVDTAVAVTVPACGTRTTTFGATAGVRFCEVDSRRNIGCGVTSFERDSLSHVHGPKQMPEYTGWNLDLIEHQYPYPTRHV
jgi:hypothetical protein